MNIYKTIGEVRFNFRSILTVGTFDGLHKGHKLIIERLIEISTDEHLRNFVITFDPHPRLVIQNAHREPIYLLTTIEERIQMFEELGVENVLIIHFTHNFSQTPPERFIYDYLVTGIGMRKILTGYDHSFGRNRGGDFEFLQSISQKIGFEVERVSPFMHKETPISSTKIREALKNSLLEDANVMLGYNYLLTGFVVKGDGRGKILGFPTANIVPTDPNKLIPARGVYLVSVTIDDNRYYGMMNIGFRPTFDHSGKKYIEVHFFDYSDDCYGKVIKVEFIKYLRQEQKFESIEELKNQLEKDKTICLSIIKEIL